MRLHDRLGALPQQRLEGEIGEALGEEALRGADQEDGLLEVTLLSDQAHLLAGVLGVVPGIGLVRDEVPDGGGEHRQVDVDRNPAAQPAQVVVEPGPRLVRLEQPLDRLAVGQTERPVGALPEVLGQRLDDRFELLARDGLRLAPLDEPLAQGTGPGERVVEAPVGGGQLVLGDRPRPHPVALLDLLLVRDHLATELAGHRVEADRLGPHPRPAPRRQVRLRAAVEVRDQVPGVVGQRRQRPGRTLLARRLELRWAVVGVDQTVEVPAEREAQGDVAGDEVRRRLPFERR